MTVPYSIVFIVAILGNLLKKAGIPFPMTTFRLRNMTTDNIIDLSKTTNIAPDLPYKWIQGIERTLKWINSKK